MDTGIYNTYMSKRRDHFGGSHSLIFQKSLPFGFVLDFNERSLSNNEGLVSARSIVSRYAFGLDIFQDVSFGCDALNDLKIAR
jgi:hypothetical protein